MIKKLTIDQKLYSILVLVSAIFLLAGVLAYVQFKAGILAWLRFEHDVSIKQELIFEIQESIGYAKGIHMFKNMVLRKDLSKANLARTHFSHGIEKIDDFLHIGSVDEEQKADLNIIKETLEEYYSKIDIAVDLIQKNVSVTEIDKAVKVSDYEAANAFDRLIASISKSNRVQRAVITGNLKRSQSNSVLIWSLCLIIGVFLIFLLISNIFNSFEKIAASAHEVASGNFSSEIQIEATGMFSGYIESINSMKENLVNYINKLEDSNKRLEEYSYIVSHDLQEPVRKVVSFGGRLNTILEGKLDEDAKFYLERIMSSSLRMRNLIDDLLSYAKVSNFVEKRVSIYLEELVNTVWKDLELRVREADAELKLGELGIVNADPTLMYQLFSNIIGNALKFRRKDVKLCVEISCNFNYKPDAYLITIKDNGIGFSQEYADRILMPFQRLHKKEDFPGTGIGLAICSKVVSLYGGKLKVESIEGQGSEFSFSLPKDRR